MKSVRAPEALRPLVEQVETLVEAHFAQFNRRPEDGMLHVGGDRYVLFRAEGVYLAWFDAMAETFGDEAARQFIYNTAREIGSADSAAFSKQYDLEDKEPIVRLACGPIHFSHAGWAFVELLEDSAPAPDDSYFVHYRHPNTFESEVLERRDRKTERPGCLFSAGYSAGWCTSAFGFDVHGRELRCVACGDPYCEFIMAPASKLDEHEKRVRASWKN